jgi:hypothetical protein
MSRKRLPATYRGLRPVPSRTQLGRFDRWLSLCEARRKRTPLPGEQNYKESALGDDRIDSVGRMDTTQAPRNRTEPLAVIQLALRSPGEAKARFPSYRLGRLVASRLQLDDLDMECFSGILELDPANPSMEQTRPFDYQLR